MPIKAGIQQIELEEKYVDEPITILWLHFRQKGKGSIIIMSQTITNGNVISSDGTNIGYLKMGNGPGIILVHGGMMSSQDFTKLGELLSDQYTVYIPDRRGRGLSGDHGNNYSLTKECEDINAIINETSTEYIFGLSSGALVSLNVALKNPNIKKVAAYEPPLPYKGNDPGAWAARYESEITNDKLAAAMTTVIKGTTDIMSFGSLPRFILEPLLFFGLKADANKKGLKKIPINTLIRSMHFDAILVAEMTNKLGNFKDLKTNVLLLGGSKSNQKLKVSLRDLKIILPNSQLVIFEGTGHLAAHNTGKPNLVANELKKFFG